MDPLTITLFSTLIILAASIIVNIFYVLDKNRNITRVATTQAIKETSPVSHEEMQVSPAQSMAETNTVQTTNTDIQVQTDLVYYVMLPNQLQGISNQLETNHKDLTHCMEWIGECEKTTLVATKAIEQQCQDLQELQKANHEHLYQELQCLRISLIQDIQF